MTTLGPADLLVKSVSNGIARTQQRPLSTLGLTVLAGAYIALGGFLAIRCGLALPWDVWGSFGKFVFAAVFPVGLMLVVLCGADLFTGNCMTLASAIYRKEISGKQAFLSGLWAWLGNFVGALFVAYCMVYASGLIFDSVNQNGTTTMPWASSLVALANGKTHLSFDAAFWRAVGCNWLVCIAVYASYAVKDGAGKIMAMWFPTMAFVAMGMEHCVANMFFVPAAIFAGSDPRYLALVESGDAVALTATWSNFFVDNLIPVTLGNIVGGAILVAGIYTMIHGRGARA
jgi:formate/nitrite transporter